jgi:hypothetical protein
MSMVSSRRDFLLGAAAALSAPAAIAQQKRPNILFVIAVDWGHNHAGVYGCHWIKTPNFDRVAKEGVLFTNCFTSNPKCSRCFSPRSRLAGLSPKPFTEFSDKQVS